MHTTSIFLVQQGVPYASLHQLLHRIMQFLSSALSTNCYLIRKACEKKKSGVKKGGNENKETNLAFTVTSLITTRGEWHNIMKLLKS